MACLREDPRDGLLDLVIALEALLEYQSDLEIAYRLKKRGGVIMGLAESRQRLPEAVAFAESTIKKSYDMRSTIVHGERTTGYSSKEIEDVNEALFVLIRTVSLKLVGLGGTSMPQKNLLGFLIDESMSSPPLRKTLERTLRDSGLLDFLED
jgi:CRISPR/Cas system CSM-associated protein Csm4 (group 5 of RAMP superfamily)